ncbi:hypothetical protein, partial [Limnohabitans sp. T6-20]|uniref:hypothetical protein n=1 Tax=Limnohabitans sp. T6-20 TaxID=1100725 RepID=UPI000DD289C3
MKLSQSFCNGSQAVEGVQGLVAAAAACFVAPALNLPAATAEWTAKAEADVSIEAAKTSAFARW